VRRLIILLAGALMLAACSSHDHDEASTGMADDSPSAHGTHSTTAPGATLVARKGEEIVTVAVPANFRPEAPTGATDEYRCFVVEPELKTDVSITGTEFVPGNPAIVHHGILYAALPEQVAAARALDAEDEGPGYECFGGSRLPSRGDALSGLDQSDWVTAWAPGGKPTQSPAGYGTPLPAGSALVIQMHYNLASTSGSDSTQVRLRVTDRAGLRPLSTMLLPAPVELPCAPRESGPLCDRTYALDDVVSRFGAGSGATIAGLQMLCGGDPDAPRSGDVQVCDRRVPADMRIFAVAGHMHLLGREITVTLNPGTNQQQVLLDIENWDFDQQAAVPLPEPVKARAGDVLRVRCRHDPGLRSQLPALQNSPPRYVLWGEGTSDEMCLGIISNG